MLNSLYLQTRLATLLPTGSEEKGVLGLGVFLLQYFPLVKMLKLLHYNCKKMYIVG